MKILKLISRKADSLIELTGKFSSLLVYFLILIITISVILRYFFSMGYVWLQDLYIWLHASIILLGVSFTLKHNGHVRIDLVYRNASNRYKKIINCFMINNSIEIFTLIINRIMFKIHITSKHYYYNNFIFSLHELA